MVLVGARTTFSARTNFIFNLKKNAQKQILKKTFVLLLHVYIYIKNPVLMSLLIEFLVYKEPIALILG